MDIVSDPLQSYSSIRNSPMSMRHNDDPLDQSRVLLLHVHHLSVVTPNRDVGFLPACTGRCDLRGVPAPLSVVEDGEGMGRGDGEYAS